MSDHTPQSDAQVAEKTTETTEEPKDSSIYRGLLTVFGIKPPANTGTTQTQQPLPETLEGHIDDIQETLGLDQNTDSEFIERVNSYADADTLRDKRQSIINEIKQRFYQHAQAYQQLQKH